MNEYGGEEGIEQDGRHLHIIIPSSRKAGAELLSLAIYIVCSALRHAWLF